MKKFIIILFTGYLLFLLGPGCKKKTTLTADIASNDEALFKLGEQFKKKDPEKARLYFRQVIDTFPKSFYAQRAKLGIGDTYFQKGDEGNLIIAASEYREFISLYPLSPSASYAQYRIAMTYYKKALGPGRDQTKTQQALLDFKKVITNYPLSEEAPDARKSIIDCEERLAEHELGIGVHYYKARAYKASTDRLIEILTEYPNYSDIDKVYFYLGDSYYRWTRIDQSIPYFRKLITDYPQSKYAKKAVERLEEIEKTNIGNKNRS